MTCLPLWLCVVAYGYGYRFPLGRLLCRWLWLLRITVMFVGLNGIICFRVSLRRRMGLGRITRNVEWDCCRRRRTVMVVRLRILRLVDRRMRLFGGIGLLLLIAWGTVIVSACVVGRGYLMFRLIRRLWFRVGRGLGWWRRRVTFG